MFQANKLVSSKCLDEDALATAVEEILDELRKVINSVPRDKVGFLGAQVSFRPVFLFYAISIPIVARFFSLVLF